MMNLTPKSKFPLQCITTEIDEGPEHDRQY